MRTDLSPSEIPTVLQDTEGILWVDIVAEAPETCEPILRERFGFHPLAIEDALLEKHVPKIDDWGDYVYLVLRALVYDQEDDGGLNTVELDIFVGRNYLVTYQSHPIAGAQRVWAVCERDDRNLKKGTGHLLYRLADELATDFVPAMEAIDDTVDRIEDRIFDNPTPEVLEEIFGLKRGLLRLRRIIGPQREVLYQLARGDYNLIDPQDRVLFRDVYDHFVRLYGISESMRDLVGSALDTYLSVVNNRMNDVMKTLTIVTALFMPLSFVVGFFGMNFFQAVITLDVWTGRAAFVLTLIGMVVTPVIMYLWMRRRAWL
jgi:magnesium transporter